MDSVYGLFDEPRKPTPETRRPAPTVTNPQEYAAFVSAQMEITGFLRTIDQDIATLDSTASPEQVKVFTDKIVQTFTEAMHRLLAIGKETRVHLAEVLPTLDRQTALDLRHDAQELAILSSIQGQMDMVFHNEPWNKPTSQFNWAGQVREHILHEIDRALLQQILPSLKKHSMYRSPTNESARWVDQDAIALLETVGKIVTRLHDPEVTHAAARFIIHISPETQTTAQEKYPKLLMSISEELVNTANTHADTGRGGLYRQSDQERAQRLYAQEQRLASERILTQAVTERLTLQTVELDELCRWQEFAHQLRQRQPEDLPLYRGVFASPLLQEITASTEEAIELRFENIGLPYMELQGAWRYSEKPENRAAYILKNIRLIAQLEKSHPGAAAFLLQDQRFNIYNFARCPLEIWQKQYEERENVTDPYGVFLFPASDWNGAFSNAHMNLLMMSAHQQLGNQVLLRVSECQNKIDLARKLISLRDAYERPAGGHKMSFAVVCGHGQKNSVTIRTPWPGAGPHSSDLIVDQDMSGPGMKRLRAFFRDDASIVLLSCSTGQEGGIAQTMSTVYQADTHAPTFPTHVDAWDFRPIGREGRVEITATFRVDHKDYPNQVPTAFYRKGMRIEPPRTISHTRTLREKLYGRQDNP